MIKHPLRYKDLLKQQLNLGVNCRQMQRLKVNPFPLSAMKLSSLAEDIRAKTREASQSTNLDVQEVLGINKVLETIHGELVNNTTKLTVINERKKKESKKLKEVEEDPTYSEEQGSYI